MASNEYINDDGMLVEEFDGGRTMKCLTEECVRENYETESKEKSPEDHCSCEECVTKRLGKEEGLNESYSMDELKENLPEEVWNELQDYLSSPDDSPPGKENDNVSVATQEEDEEEDVEKQFGDLPRSPYEKPDAGYDDVEEGQANQLDAFYEEGS